MEQQLRIALIAHEFGRYKGHGGIATYLQNFADAFVELQKQSLFSKDIVLYFIYHDGFEPSFYSDKYPDNVKLIKLPQNKPLAELSKIVSHLIRELQIKIVEVSDYLAYSYQALVDRLTYQFHQDVIFYVNHHTAVREIIEWSTGLEFKQIANFFEIEQHNREYAQYLLADFHIAPSNFLARYLSEKYKLNLHNTYPYPYNISDIPSKEHFFSLHLGKEVKNIVYVTRFELRKKQENLILSVIEILQKGRDDINIYLVGGTCFDALHHQNYRDYVESLIPKKFRHHFKFFDFLSFNEFKQVYKEATVFVMASNFENFPNAAIESILLGVPTIGSIYSGIKDMIGAELEEFCFDPMKEDSLQEKIVKIIDQDKTTLQEIAKKQFLNLQRIVDPYVTVKEKIELFANLTEKQNYFKLEERVYSNAILITGFGKLDSYSDLDEWSQWINLKQLNIPIYFDRKSVEKLNILGEYLVREQNNNQIVNLFVIPFGSEKIEPIIHLASKMKCNSNLKQAVISFSSNGFYPTILEHFRHNIERLAFILPYANIPANQYANVRGEIQLLQGIANRQVIISVDSIDITVPDTPLGSFTSFFKQLEHPYIF